MSYATLQNLKDDLGAALYNQLTDLAGGTTPSDAVGQQRIDLAEAQLNARLGQRYLTPVDVSADAALAATMRWMTLAFAVHDLFGKHPSRPRQRDTDHDNYKQVVALLDKIAAGTAALPGAAEIPAAVSSGTTAQAIGDDRVFTRDAMEGL